MRRLRKAKIVATLGPSSSERATILALAQAGADVFRLNFSHGTHEQHKARLELIRAIETEIDRPIGVLLDLQGPKLRIGTFSAGSIHLSAGQHFSLDMSDQPGDETRVSLPHPEIFAALQIGSELLLDDGRVRLEVLSCNPRQAATVVRAGGALSDRKGVNVPGVVLPLSPLTTKDRLDLDYGLSLGVDWVALSFVQRPEDILELKALVAGRAQVMAKLEKPLAIECLEDIVAAADGIMVARGDLGVEMPPELVPPTQKRIVRVCRAMGTPVIVATQMLESMVSAPVPTRAEASDVATAIYDGADAVMLSAESASGQYPREAVAMMSRIIESTERHKMYRSILNASEPGEEETAPHAVAAAAADLAAAINASAIVAFTSSGTTAARIARKRPKVALLAVTPDQTVSRQLCLLWGAHSVLSQDIHSYEEMVERASATALTEAFAQPADSIVVVAGIPFGEAGTTNNLRVVQLGRAA